ncbi:threonine aldolase family protein [Radicibacter daui]|uniref:threonine aldolase family protein n=1 Tax=Radicibacter daui TaxID=3064829 RepID=UPI004046E36B
MIFNSDNVAGAAPEIVAALVAAATGPAMPYGADPWTASVEKKLAAAFETDDIAVFPVATGTAANVTALSAIMPPWGAVLCHEASHINVDESSAPEFYTGGRLVGLAGEGGKLSLETVERALRTIGQRGVHQVQPRVLSLTQATESGTVYTPDEIRALSSLAHEKGCKVQMDGARFANAIAHLGCSPADVTWKAGVDVLSFGATKNGCMAAEAVIFFGKDKAGDYANRRKRGGHLFSKMRFISAQLDAYLEGGLWLKLARHANDKAARLAKGLTALPGFGLLWPVEANELFVTMPPAVIDRLSTTGAGFYRWDEGSIRLVTSFATTDEEVGQFLSVAATAAGAAA